MRFSIYIADGDKHVVRTVKNMIFWHVRGFHVIGSCGNPASVMDEIIQKQPHVVIFDRECLHKSVNTFMKDIRAAGWDCAFIVITEEFRYESARNFFLNGGYDYLLKSMNTSELSDTLKRLYKKLCANTA